MPSSFNPNSPGVSLVIPTWNGRRLLSRYLPSAITAADSYARHAGASVEIIVVDDGSTDGTAAWLQAAHPRIIILRTEVNQGFAWACNLGFARAAHPIILLLNNDVRVDANILPLLVDHFSDPSVFAVCCKALDPETGHVATAGKVGEFKRGFWRVHGNYDVVRGPWSVAPGPWPVTSYNRQPTTDTTPYYSILASGGFSAFAAEKLRQLGGFNTLLSPFYWEDVDLSLRAWKRGWRILYEPRAVVYHSASSTIGTHFAPRQIKLIAQRNRLLAHWINLHDRGWWLEHIAVVALLLISSLLTLNLTFWQAFIDALGKLPRVWEQRRRERRAAKVSDRELARLMARATARPDVRNLDTSSTQPTPSNR